MEKTDFKKDFKALYTASSKQAVLVEVPVFQFLMIDGQGDPNTSAEFQKAAQTFYGVVYSLKMGWKFNKIPRPANYADFNVPPLEALWWMADGSDFDMERKADWRWTLLLMTPDFFTRDAVNDALSDLQKKKADEVTTACRLERWGEGLAVQIMHIGPYNAEGPTLEKLHGFALQNGYSLTGKHHEIYLSDPRRTAPEKLKTILRHPVKK